MTLIGAIAQNESIGMTGTARPILLNGWSAEEPVAVWEADGRVNIAGTVQHGPPGTAAFELDEAHHPEVGVVVSPEVDITTAGEVVVHDGPAPQAIEANFRKPERAQNE